MLMVLPVQHLPVCSCLVRLGFCLVVLVWVLLWVCIWVFFGGFWCFLVGFFWCFGWLVWFVFPPYVSDVRGERQARVRNVLMG